MEIVEKRPVSLPEMEIHIQEMKKRDKELNFRSKKVEEYLKNVPKVKEYEKLIKADSPFLKLFIGTRFLFLFQGAAIDLLYAFHCDSVVPVK